MPLSIGNDCESTLSCTDPNFDNQEDCEAQVGQCIVPDSSDRDLSTDE